MPPRTTLFVRDAGATLNSSGSLAAPLTGTLRKGKKKTVVRIDATIVVQGVQPLIPGVFVRPSINGVAVGALQLAAAPCSTVAGVCSASGSFWFDLDALEAENPGAFVGQPLQQVPAVGNPSEIVHQREVGDLVAQAVHRHQHETEIQRHRQEHQHQDQERLKLVVVLDEREFAADVGEARHEPEHVDADDET